MLGVVVRSGCWEWLLGVVVGSFQDHEQFEDTKDVISNCKSMTDRQYNILRQKDELYKEN